MTQPTPFDAGPPPIPPYGVPVRPVVGTTHLVVAWVVAFVSGFYMLPWAIAATRQKSNTVTIAWVNALLGWTVVGWVVAFIMACTTGRTGPHRPSGFDPHPVPGVPAGWYADASGTVRWWDGVRWTDQTAR